MNLYFVLEGEKTEVLLYPKWINHFLPEMKQVFFEKDAIKNNFYIFSGGGIPSIYNTTVNAIKNINDNPVFNKLIVCLDGEELGIEGRLKEITEYLEKSGVKLNDGCSLEFIIQNICIETWFLGNRKTAKKIPEGIKLREFLQYFNVVENDPEQMDNFDGYRNKAHFHYSYFREILKEHNLSYSKSRPKIVLESSYIESLIQRTNDTLHLRSLKTFFNLMEEIRLNK